MKFDPEVNPILEYISSNTDAADTRSYAFKNGIAFYNRKKYFEAHEIFEFQWKKEIGNRKIFIHALIQISVAMNKLYIKVNLKGAFSQTALALEKIQVLIKKDCLTKEGIAYSYYLTENLESLLALLSSGTVDYTSYSPPVLGFDPERLFL